MALVGGIQMFKKLFQKKRNNNHIDRITMISNVIQYDEMGYPLRLVMIDIGDGLVEHVWRDTNERDGDVVLEWKYV